MSSSSFKRQAFCLALGALVGIAVIYLLGFSMAISSPDGFFDWFKSIDALDVGLALWHLLVAYSLAVGLPAFLVLSAAFLFFRPTVASVASYVAGLLLVLHVMYPLAYGYPVSNAFLRPWWGYGLELSLFTAAALALFIARRRSGSSFKANPIRRSA